MSNTELLSQKVVLSQIQFEKDGFNFLDSTERLMPKSETALENKSTFIARHKIHLMNRLGVRKKDGFASSKSTFDI